MEEEREKLSEAETALYQRQSEIEASQARWTAQETSYKAMLQSTQDQLKTMEQTLTALRKEQDSKIQHASAHERVEHLQTQLSEALESARETAEQSQLREHELTKDRALKEQKIHFLELQLQDVKRQLEEAHRQHEQTVKALRTGYKDEYESPEVRAARL